MKAITILLSDVEAEMLVEVQERDQKYRNTENLQIKAIRDEWRCLACED